MILRFRMNEDGEIEVFNSRNFYLGCIIKLDSGRYVWSQSPDCQMWADCLQKVVNKILELEK